MKKLQQQNYMKHAVLSLTLLAVSCLTFTAQAGKNDQLWLSGTIKGTLTDKLSIKLKEQIRYKDGDYYWRYTEPGVSYALSESWSVAGSFRYVTKRNSADDWLEVYGYVLDSAYVLNGFGAELKSRFRFIHYDPRFDFDPVTDFRPKFILSPEKGVTPWSLKPYVAEEMMYNFDRDILYRNRLSAGLKCKPFKQFAIGAFLMHESTKKNGEWTENLNYGMSAIFSF